jgi:Rho termination factor, N-terminal domain
VGRPVFDEIAVSEKQHHRIGSVGKSGGKSGSYQDSTVTELKKRAKELGLSGYSSLTKDELINKIRNH